MRAGTVDPKPVAPELVAFISSGRANLSFIVSREIGIDDAPDGYAKFDKHRETKVVIRFPSIKSEKYTSDGNEPIVQREKCAMNS